MCCGGVGCGVEEVLWPVVVLVRCRGSRLRFLGHGIGFLGGGGEIGGVDGHWW